MIHFTPHASLQVCLLERVFIDSTSEMFEEPRGVQVRTAPSLLGGPSGEGGGAFTVHMLRAYDCIRLPVRA
jgi:hypothetical protein